MLLMMTAIATDLAMPILSPMKIVVPIPFIDNDIKQSTKYLINNEGEWQEPAQLKLK